MTAVRHRAPRTERPRADRRKLLAIASAFSVLGVGAGVTTLASWQQTHYVNGAGSTAIGASVFCVEESVNNGSTWINSTVNGATSALSFTPTSALALSPGDALFAYVQFRTCATSTRAGSLTLSGVTGAGTSALATALTYGVVANVASSSACGTSAFASPAAANLMAPASTLLSATGAPTTTAITLPVGSGGSGGTAVGFCFEVGLPSGTSASAQGTSATPTWTFNAASS